MGFDELICLYLWNDPYLCCNVVCPVVWCSMFVLDRNIGGTPTTKRYYPIAWTSHRIEDRGVNWYPKRAKESKGGRSLLLFDNFYRIIAWYEIACLIKKFLAYFVHRSVPAFTAQLTPAIKNVDEVLLPPVSPIHTSSTIYLYTMPMSHLLTTNDSLATR